MSARPAEAEVIAARQHSLAAPAHEADGLDAE